MTAQDVPASLNQLIEKTGALQSGHFQLASGLHATRFFRCIQLLRYPSAADIIFDALSHRFVDEAIACVLGANEAGSILAFEVARRLNAEVAIARQSAGHQYQLIEGFAFKANQRVLVVDDITTTGGTAKQLIALIEAAQAQPVGVGLIATKGLFQVDLGYPTEVLITLDGMDAFPSESCALCEQKVPLTR